MPELGEHDEWQVPYRADLPTAEQVAAFMAALALVSPAALGGMPVLPVTLDDERRRQQEQILQESASSVGVYQDVHEAEAALSLSQRRLVAATREVTGTTAHVVSEGEVVDAAQRVLAGEASPRQSLRFRSALGRVATDSADYYMLREDASLDADADAAGELPVDEDDPDAWDPYRFD